MWVRVSRRSEAPQDRPCALAPPPRDHRRRGPQPRAARLRALRSSSPRRLPACLDVGRPSAAQTPQEGLGLIPPRVLASLAGPLPTLDAKGRDALVRRGRGMVSLRKGPRGAVPATVHGSSGAHRG